MYSTARAVLLAAVLFSTVAWRQKQPRAQRQTEAAQRANDLRFSIYRLVSVHIEVKDTPRGLVVTLPEQDFNLNKIEKVARQPVAEIASVLREYPGVVADVTPRGIPIDNDPRALAVQALLIADGAPANAVFVHAPSKTPTAAPLPADVQQKGVEICIRGEPIGRP